MEKSAENCKIFQRLEISRQILDKIGAQKNENLHCLKDILIFYIFYYFMKKSCLVIKLHHFKVPCLDFPIKIVTYVPFF